MKEALSQLVQSVLKELNLDGLTVTITPTDDPTHGDYATNVAFQAAKKLNKNPREAAEMIVQKLQEKNAGSFDQIEVAGPGFINFTLSQAVLLKNLSIEHKKLASPSFAQRKVMIEFTDPNPFKEFHIGHLYDNIIGESLSRILESVGAEVRRVTYQGDVGLHVAKSLWGMQQEFQNESLTLSDLEQKPLDERAKFLGQAYALGATKYEEDATAKQEIIELNKQVYAVIASKAKQSPTGHPVLDTGSSQIDSGAGAGMTMDDQAPRNDDEIAEMYSKGRQWSLEYFDTIYDRLGSKFTKNYFESEAGPIGLNLVLEYLKKGVFKESEGAVVFPGEEHGLHTRVFINSLGLPTYEAKELGLAPTKYKDYPYDLSIIVTGNEINEYFKVLLKAISIIYPDLAEKTLHISHGMVRLPEGKMSSRTGNVKTGEWLLNEAVARAQDKIDEAKRERGSTPTDKLQLGVEPLKGKQLSGAEEVAVAEMVGVGAVKWALLRSSIGKDVEFSFDESVSFEGNSGPYLQYTYVRTRSVLSKAGEGAYKMNVSELKLTPEERSLLVLLTQYSDIVLDAAEKYSPSTITTYLFNLAQAYNLFYQKHPILKEEGNTRTFRLMLTSRVGDTIKDGLNLLGIKTPERM